MNEKSIIIIIAMEIDENDPMLQRVEPWPQKGGVAHSSSSKSWTWGSLRPILYVCLGYVLATFVNFVDMEVEGGDSTDFIQDGPEDIVVSESSSIITKLSALSDLPSAKTSAAEAAAVVVSFGEPWPPSYNPPNPRAAF